MNLSNRNIVYFYFILLSVVAIYFEYESYKTEMLLVSQRTYFAQRNIKCCVKTHPKSYQRMQAYLKRDSAFGAPRF